MTYAPALVANAFLYRAKQTGRKLNHAHVQKLVFFLHAWSLTLDGQSLVSERPEAWQYGPLFSSLYHRLKAYGRKTIDLLPEFHPETGQLRPLIPSRDDRRLWFLVDQVMDRYGRFTSSQLCALSHEPGGAWEETRDAKVTVMADEVIRRHFLKKIPDASIVHPSTSRTA